MPTTIIAFILILSVLVFVHELGHFLAARKFGAKAEEFGLGFPPRLFGFYKSTSGAWKYTWWRKEVIDAADTIYSINLIPLGGFVKIQGEDGADKKDEMSFANKPIWQRTIILCAGVLMNVLLAVVIFTGMFFFGSNQSLEGLPQNGAKITNRHLEVVSVNLESPAARADIKPGDTIVAIDGHEMMTVDELQEYVSDKAGKSLTYTIKRGDEELTKEITPIILQETNRGGIGIAPSEIGFIRYPWYRSIIEGVKTTGIFLWLIITGFADLISRLVTGHSVSNEVSGIVGIAVLTGQVADLGFSYLFQFAALLSLNLAFINILPIPALDGGRILFLIVEKIKGRPVKQETEAMVHNIGFMLLIGLMILVTFTDIKRLFN